MKLLPSFGRLVNESFTAREIRAEILTCQVWLSVIVATYGLFVLFVSATVSADLVRNITILSVVTGTGFTIIIMLSRRGYYSPALKYVNTFLQVSLVSGAIVFDNLAQGPAYTLSSMPPMAYALVPTITAFRLQPWLSLFSGVVAAGQFLLLYLLVLQPSPELVATLPSLGLPVTFMKVVILLALGVASAFAASYLLSYFKSYGDERALSNRLSMSFGRFVSPRVVDEIKSSDTGMIPASQQQAVIVFGDIRNFSRYADHHNPQQVAQLLNEFFANVCREVEAAGGMVNKFLGDGYLAFFGLFSDDPAPCRSAVRSLFAIHEKTAKLLQPHGLDVGAAVHYGEVITGELGSRDRCEFTAIGASVNLASRLEGFNRELGTSLLASAAFVNSLPPGTCRVRSCGSWQVKGFAEPVEIFALEPEPGAEAADGSGAQVR